MRTLPTILRPLLALTLWVALCCPAQAQIIIDVPGSNDVPMAIPKPQLPSGDPDGRAEEIWATVHRDLQLTGYFRIIDPAAYIEQDKGVEPGTFDRGDWTVLGATVLVKTRVLPATDPTCDPDGRRICADVFVYYLVSGDQLLAKRFRTEAKRARRAGHRIADAVVLAVTGRPGFFSARIAAVGSQSGNKEIYLLDIDGKGVVPVTSNGSINLSPAWSPDGRSLAWTSYKKSNPDMYVKNLLTGRTRAVSNRKGINVSPAWSPDGRVLALARTGTHDTDLFLVDSGIGTEIRQLTRGGGIDVSPHFSTSGNLLAFASERSGGSQVYVMDLDSNDTRRVSFVGDFNSDPVISPDGTRLAFVARSDTGFDVVASDIDGRNAIRITQDMGDNEDPVWSPDGMYLLFSSTRSGRSELWLSTADGRHQMPITRSGGWTQPAWAPQAAAEVTDAHVGPETE